MGWQIITSKERLITDISGNILERRWKRLLSFFMQPLRKEVKHMDILIHIDGLNIYKKDFAKSKLNPLLYKFSKDLERAYPKNPVVLHLRTDVELLDSDDILNNSIVFKQPKKED
jgi:hypothetical protein